MYYENWFYFVSFKLGHFYFIGIKDAKILFLCSPYDEYISDIIFLDTGF